MTSFVVVETPRFVDDLEHLLEHLVDAGAQFPTAARFVRGVRADALKLDLFPYRGRSRGDLRPGLRILAHERRAVIAYEVDEDGGEVRILRAFYAGRDYEAIMRDQEPGDE